MTLKIRKIVLEDYQKDIETIEAFVEEKMNRAQFAGMLTPESVGRTFTALYMGTLARLVIGFPDREVHDRWIKSMKLIWAKHQKRTKIGINFLVS